MGKQALAAPGTLLTKVVDNDELGILHGRIRARRPYAAVATDGKTVACTNA